MDQLLEKLGWKKLGITIIIFTFLFLVFIIISMARGVGNAPAPRSAVPTQGANANSGGGGNPNQPQSLPSFVTPTTSVAGWQTFSSPSISITFPPNWVSQLSNIPGGGSSFIIKSNDPVFPPDTNIEVQIFSNKDTSMDKLTPVFQSLGYSQKDTKVNNVPARVFQGTLGASVPLQEKVIIFDKNAKVYKIQLGYRNNARNFQLEDILDKVVGSVN